MSIRTPHANVTNFLKVKFALEFLRNRVIGYSDYKVTFWFYDMAYPKFSTGPLHRGDDICNPAMLTWLIHKFKRTGSGPHFCLPGDTKPCSLRNRNCWSALR